MSNELAVMSDKELQAAFGSVGFGEFGKDIRFPYVSIAAKNTDLAVEGSESYIDGLKPGFLFNSLTKRVYGKSIKVIILDYSTVHREFKKEPSGQKGDYVRDVPATEIKTFSNDQLRDYTKFGLPNGNVLEEVKMFYLVLPEYKDDGIVKFSASKGSFKHVRNWGAMIVRTGKPFPAHIWEVSTGMMKDDKNSWFAIGDNDTTFVKDCGPVAREMMLDVKEAFDLVQSIKNAEAARQLAERSSEKAVEEDDGVPY